MSLDPASPGDQEQTDQSTSAGSAAAHDAFADFLRTARSGSPEEFEAFCADRPQLAADMRELYANWRELQPMLGSLLERDVDLNRLLDTSAEPRAPGVDQTFSLQVAEGGEQQLSPSEIVDQLARAREATDKYRAEGEIARGGMGIVRQVFDETLKRHLAMKVMLPRKGTDGIAPKSNGGHGTRTGSNGAGVAETNGTNGTNGNGTNGSHGTHDGAGGSAGPSNGASATDARRRADERDLSQFLYEAAITGQLDHPGIVPVHELGVDERGEVYFTMKLVKGRDFKSILELVHGRREGWNTNRAVAVVLRVCEAIAYAHSKGVIHRDIKPSNIMVGRYGESYLMDWGLAKTLDGSASPEAPIAAPPDEPPMVDDEAHADTWLFTADGDLRGTPPYMSPEQARGDVDLVDQRSDIYSLGAVLYHLLSGKVPYCDEGDPQVPFFVIRKVQREPPTPVRDLASEAPEGLLAICERAMQREIDERYASATEMARDIENYLADVSEDREEARRQARRAELVVKFLMDMLDTGDPDRAQGRDVTVLEVLDEAARKVESALHEMPHDEAPIRSTIGNLYKQQGHFDLALPHLVRAHELYRAHRGDGCPETLKAATDLALLERARGRLDRAESLVRRTLDVQDRSLGATHEQTLRTLSTLASLVHQAKGRLSEAQDLYRRAWDGSRQSLGDDHPQTFEAANGLAGVLKDRGRLGEAEEIMRANLEGLLRVHGERHSATAIAMNNLATLLWSRGRLAEAEKWLRRKLTVQRLLLRETHPSVLKTMNNLGMLLMRQGKLDEAEGLLRSALEAQRARLGDDHADTIGFLNNVALVVDARGRNDEALELFEEVLARADVVLPADHYRKAWYRFNYGRCLMVMNAVSKAETELRLAHDLLRRALGPRHEKTRRAAETLVALYLRTGRPELAQEFRDDVGADGDG